MLEKHDILTVIKKNMVKAVDNLDAENIDEMKPMTEYGANSLDIVDVVSTTMRELKIKVPRTELVHLKNIDDLANLFYKHAKQAEQSH
jgi:polyketide biosynthesis acyl carrier protein